MANPAATRLPGEQAIAARRARLLIDYGILLVSVAGSAIIRIITVSSTSAVGGPVYHVMVTLLLFLLGVSMLMMGLAAADQYFPRAARAGVAIAWALLHYLFGGGN